MYVLQQPQSNTDKIVAGLVTAFFLSGSFLALRLTSIPEVEQKPEVYEEINWSKFKPKPEKIAEPPKPEPIKVDQPKIIETLPQPAPKPRVVKVDLSSLQNMQFAELSKPAQNLQHRETERPSSSNQTKIDLKSSSLSAGLNTMLGESSLKLSLPKSGSKGRSNSNTPRLQAKSGKSVETGRGADFSSGGQALGAPESKDVTGGAPQVNMVDMSDLGGDFSDLSPIYRELIVWMKRNPANFPMVVKRFTETKSGDLTSVISFQIGGRDFQMFLLCKERLNEVRICLLEGRQSTYLIDRGLKESGSYLRVGSVNRTPTKKILSFGTVRKEASNQRASEFYQVFFSWWESVKT